MLDAPVARMPPTAPAWCIEEYGRSYLLMSASPGPPGPKSPPGVFAAELLVESDDADVDGRTLRP